MSVALVAGGTRGIGLAVARGLVRAKHTASQSDPSSPWYPMMVPAYQTSKAAVNSITIALSKKLADESMVVTSVCPGWAQTDLAPGNHEQAPLTADEAAGVVIGAALAPDGTPSGRFVDASGPVRW